MLRSAPAMILATLTTAYASDTLGAAGAASAPEAPASAGLEARARDELVYPFVVLPRRLVLSDKQVERVREAAVDQVIEFHKEKAEANRAAAAGHKRYLEILSSSDAHDQWNRQHMETVLAAQHRNSQVIFVVVLSIVALALLLTVYQFVRDSGFSQRVAMRLLRSASKSEIGGNLQAAQKQIAAPSGEASISDSALSAVARLAAEHPESKDALLELLKEYRQTNNVTLGPNGLQLGSQIVGLVVLIFALAFFYLYLTNVYPISIEQLPEAASAPSK